MVKWICMNEILFAEIYYICIAIMLILGFKTYRSMMKNSQKVSFLAVVFVHILYFQTDLVRMSNVQNLFLNEMSFLFFSLCTFSWFNYILTMLEIQYVKKRETLICQRHIRMFWFNAYTVQLRNGLHRFYDYAIKRNC